MENEIKVGEYCRTRKGIIGILKQQFTFGHGVNYPEPQEWVIDVKGKKYVTTECDVDFDNIVKHSPNIIDLIEERRLCKWKRSNRNKRMELFKRWLF